MGLLFAVHLSLIPVVLFLGNSVPNPDGSHLGTAILLKRNTPPPGDYSITNAHAKTAVVSEIEKERGPARSKQYHKDISYSTRYTCDNGKDYYYMSLTKEEGRASLPDSLRDLETRPS